MSIIQAWILGVIQGLTEFLPISSSGHLVIAQRLFGLVEPGIAFDISVHLGTLAAVVIFFRKEILEVNDAAIAGCKRLFAKQDSFSTLYANEHGFRLAMLLAAGSIPTAIIGIFLQTISELLFTSIALTGGMLIVTGIILVLTGVLLWITKNAKASEKGLSEFSLKTALWIGVVQGFAIIPGISRSGSTIAAGLLLGLDKKTAGTFSFLLSIPAIIGAAGLHVVLSGLDDIQIIQVLIGLLTSFVIGFLSLGILMRIVKRGRLYVFAPYCLVVGIVVLVVSL